MDFEEQTTLVSIVDHFKRPVTLTTVVLALGCAILWGGQSVAIRLAVEDIPPLTVIFLRLLLATVTLAFIAILGRQPLRVNRRQALFLFGNSLFLAIHLGLFTMGTSLTSSVRSIVLINTVPLFAALACHWFLPGFGFTRTTIVGLTVAVAGVIIVFLDRLFVNSANDPSNWRGDLLVLGAAVTIGLKIPYTKTLLRSVSPIQFSFWVVAMATPLAMAVCWNFERSLWSTVGSTSAMAVIYQGCIVSVFAVLVWTTLLSQHAPNDLTPYRLLSPLIGVLLGWMILHESPTYLLILGSIFVVAGIYLVNTE